MEAQQLQLELLPVDLTKLIRDLALIHRSEALTKGIDFQVVWGDHVPRSVSTDPHRLQQILTNVIGNAIKFTERGYVKLEICACSQEEATALLTFDVTDTGRGISRALGTRLFRPFEQADSSPHRQFGGTGLGLALSKHLANAMGGDLTLKQSTPGRGSTFSFSLNVTVLDGTLNKKTLDANSLLEQRLTGHRILVADDSPDNRYLLSHLLKKEGAAVSFAENGREAVEKASQEDFDVVLMDIQMPQMDGLEASAQLRANGYIKPIIALTAHAMKEDRLRSLSAGLNDHVTKPINREELIRAVQRWVWSSQASAI